MKIAKYYLKLLPERCVAFADRDAKVDGVWERMIPVCPVIRADSVIAADVAIQWPDEHDVSINVDSAVLYHEIDAPHVRHV